MNELEILKKRIAELEKFKAELEKFKADLEVSWKIPREIDESFRKRFLGDVVSSTDIITVPKGGTGVATLTGIVKASGVSNFTAIAPLAGSKVYYVANSSGGAVDRKLTFTDGVLTAET